MVHTSNARQSPEPKAPKPTRTHTHKIDQNLKKLRIYEWSQLASFRGKASLSRGFEFKEPPQAEATTPDTGDQISEPALILDQTLL